MFHWPVFLVLTNQGSNVWSTCQLIAHIPKYNPNNAIEPIMQTIIVMRNTCAFLAIKRLSVHCDKSLFVPQTITLLYYLYDGSKLCFCSHYGPLGTCYGTYIFGYVNVFNFLMGNIKYRKIAMQIFKYLAYILWILSLCSFHIFFISDFFIIHFMFTIRTIPKNAEFLCLHCSYSHQKKPSKEGN